MTGDAPSITASTEKPTTEQHTSTSRGDEPTGVQSTSQQNRREEVDVKVQNSLNRTHQLHTKRLALMHEWLRIQKITSSLSDSDVRSSNETYWPSIASHSTPSCIPRLSRSGEDKILQDAKDMIKQHIQRLHSYNEIKDVAQALMGMIAESRGVRIKELYESLEFGVSESD